MNARRPNQQLMPPFAAQGPGEARVQRPQGVEAIKTAEETLDIASQHQGQAESPVTSNDSWMDSWIRRRLRAAAWRAWRHPRKRFGELVKRGATLGEAAIAVRRFRNPWRAGIDRALEKVLPARLWTKLGLLNLQSQWRAMNP